MKVYVMDVNCVYTMQQNHQIYSNIKKIGSYCLKYDCQRCEYQAIQLGNFRHHEALIHEDNIYDCKQCEYRATELGSLMRHEASIH